MDKIGSLSVQTPGGKRGRLSSNYTNLINPLNAELDPICHLLALLGAHHILHVSRIRIDLT